MPELPGDACPEGVGAEARPEGGKQRGFELGLPKEQDRRLWCREDDGQGLDLGRRQFLGAPAIGWRAGQMELSTPNVLRPRGRTETPQGGKRLAPAVTGAAERFFLKEKPFRIVVCQFGSEHAGDSGGIATAAVSRRYRRASCRVRWLRRAAKRRPHADIAGCERVRERVRLRGSGRDPRVSAPRLRDSGELRRARRSRSHSCWDHLIAAPLWPLHGANLGT